MFSIVAVFGTTGAVERQMYLSVSLAMNGILTRSMGAQMPCSWESGKSGVIPVLCRSC